MRPAFWQQLLAAGCPLPPQPSLDELTTELVGMLGDTRSEVREGVAVPVLSAWIGSGVYDHLLAGLGDGLVPGLRWGLGEPVSDAVVRRAACAAVLRAVVSRDNAVGAVHAPTLLAWADRAVTWLLAERDLRGWLPGAGPALALGRGAELLGVLAASPHLGAEELAVLLDVVAERLLLPTEHRFCDGEGDHLAAATVAVLHRNLLAVEALEAWLDRLAAGLRERRAGAAPARRPAVVGNASAYLRALHLALLLGRPGDRAPAPVARGDLLLALQRVLREDLAAG